VQKRGHSALQARMMCQRDQLARSERL
jgi:hypothetical protein